MTGRELMLYILQNKLEDEIIIETMSVEEAAVLYGVGLATIRAWWELGLLDGFDIGGCLYLFKGLKNQNNEQERGKDNED